MSEPIIIELTFLETSGIEIDNDNEKFPIYFVLSLLIGDNLGINSILGYVESFSANFCCRFCSFHKSELHKMCKEDVKLMRTKVIYENEILINDSSITGRKEVADNSSVDIMQDIYEGIAPTEILLLY